MKRKNHQPQDYGSLASYFYDLTKPIDGDYPDVPYYLEHLSEGYQRILEIGAGTGRLCIPLILEGHNVEALECAEPMIQCLQKNLKAQRKATKIHRLRAEDMNFKNEFDAIIVSFGSFQLFSELELAQRCLRLFRKALRPGGKLFVDLDVIRPEPHRAGLKTYGTTLELEKDESLLLEGSRTWDFVAQKENVHLRYELWRKGKLSESELQNFSLRWYGQWEFQALLRDVGFSNIVSLADYGETEAHADTQVYNFIAQN